jgi:hypothetical protein
MYPVVICQNLGSAEIAFSEEIEEEYVTVEKIKKVELLFHRSTVGSRLQNGKTVTVTNPLVSLRDQKMQKFDCFQILFL